MTDNGFVPFPNEIIDNIMPKLSANGWKVFCFVWRKTRGWKKTEDHISISQIMDGTGIGSNNTVKTAIKEIGKIINVENGRGRGNLHSFDISTLVIKDAVIAPLIVKDAEIAPINPLKDAVFDVKDAEIAHTTDTIQQTKKEEAQPLQILHRDLALKASAIVGYDKIYLTPNAISELNQLTDFLNTAAATIQDLEYFECNYWWGKTRPSIGQVKKYWAAAMAQKVSSANGKVKSGITLLPGVKEQLARIEAENG